MAAIAPARYIPHDAPVSTFSTDKDKTAAGRDSTPATSPEMNRQMNPDAPSFRPGGYHTHQGAQDHDGFAIQPPYNANYAPPPPFNHSQQAYHNYAAQSQAQAYYHQWLQHYTHQAHQASYQPAPQPYVQPYIQLNYGAQLPFGQQIQRGLSNAACSSSDIQSQAHLPYRGTREDLQYAFDILIQGLRSKNRYTNSHHRAFTPPIGDTQPAAAADVQAKQREYEILHRVALCAALTPRINKLSRNTKVLKAQSQTQKKGRYGDKKIMLPAPQPTPEYLSQAAKKPSAVDPPGHVLVILDLNGTVLYRPNKNAKTMIERPFLKPFLRYLFQNYSVMVWSSAKPDNVKSLVMQSLDNHLQSKLVARWARDSFGLSPANYNQNVQVYKNLKLVWSRDVIQQHHPQYTKGQRFGQHNTVLIDDSAIKAAAQPHNLLEVPEFSATPEQLEGDVLREVAGYLEVLRQQADVSQFINQEPFKDDGRWSFEWPDEAAGGGEMKSKVSMQRIKQRAKKAGGEDRKKLLNTMDHETKVADAADTAKTGGSLAPLSDTINSLVSVPLVASMQKDW